MRQAQSGRLHLIRPLLTSYPRLGDIRQTYQAQNCGTVYGSLGADFDISDPAQEVDNDAGRLGAFGGGARCGVRAGVWLASMPLMYRS